MKKIDEMTDKYTLAEINGLISHKKELIPDAPNCMGADLRYEVDIIRQLLDDHETMMRALEEVAYGYSSINVDAADWMQQKAEKALGEVTK